MLRDMHGDEFAQRFGLGFSAIDDPYEAPENPELVLLATEKTPDELADEVIEFLKSNNFITNPKS